MGEKEVCFDQGTPISERKGDSERKAGFRQLPLLGSLLRMRECAQTIKASRLSSICDTESPGALPNSASAAFPLLGVRE